MALQQDMRDLFKLDNPRFSQTQQQLAELHQGHRIKESASTRAHVEFLSTLHAFGLSDHDLV